MIIDKENTFASATAVTATGQVGNVIDLGPKGALGNGIGFFVDVGTVFAGTAGGTCTIALQGCDYSGFGTSPATLCSSGAIALASLTANTKVWEGVVPSANKRYLRLYATNSVTFTGGTVDAGLTFDNQTNTQANS